MELTLTGKGYVCIMVDRHQTISWTYAQRTCSSFDIVGNILDVLVPHATRTRLKTLPTTSFCSRSCALNWTSSSQPSVSSSPLLCVLSLSTVATVDQWPMSPPLSLTLTGFVSDTCAYEENGKIQTAYMRALLTMLCHLMIFVALMVYDIHGSWTKTTGPNAPFGTPSAPGEPFSVIQAVKSWKTAGWPSDKLVVGTAFYGAAFTATVNMDTQNPITQYVPHTGSALLKRQEGNLTIAACAAAVVAAEEGSWRWKDIRKNVLTGGPTTPAAGWTRHWDPESQTPWLFRASDKKFVSYDDPQSLTVKVNYVKQQSLRGVMLWDISYDYQQELINALNQVHCTTDCPTVTTTPAVPTSTVAVTTTSVKITTTTATIPTTTSIPGNCNGVPAWNSGTIYATAGTKVTYNGRLWTNQWWTQGETPSSSTWGVWKDGGAC